MAKFVANEEKCTNISNGKKRELGFTFSFPVKQRSVASGTLVKWTKAFSIDDAVSLHLSVMPNLSFSEAKFMSIANPQISCIAAALGS